MFDVGHMWRLATRESADFQKQLADFHLTAQHFTHSAETFCLATREQQAKHAPELISSLGLLSRFPVQLLYTNLYIYRIWQRRY